MACRSRPPLPPATAVSLQSSSPAAVYGQTVTFTAIVSAVAPGLPVPAGAIEFFDGATGIGNVHVDATGTASLQVSNLSAADHTITAQYLGDLDFSISTSAELNRTVGRAHLTVTADDKSKPYGASNPGLTYSLEGFVNGETASVVTGAPSLSTTATPATVSVPLDCRWPRDLDILQLRLPRPCCRATLSVAPAPLTIRADEIFATRASPIRH